MKALNMRTSNLIAHCVLPPVTLSVMRELGKLTSTVVKRGGITRLEKAHLAVCVEHILQELEESCDEKETTIFPTPESERSET